MNYQSRQIGFVLDEAVEAKNLPVVTEVQAAPAFMLGLPWLYNFAGFMFNPVKAQK